MCHDVFLLVSKSNPNVISTNIIHSQFKCYRSPADTIRSRICTPQGVVRVRFLLVCPNSILVFVFTKSALVVISRKRWLLVIIALVQWFKTASESQECSIGVRTTDAPLDFILWDHLEFKSLSGFAINDADSWRLFKVRLDATLCARRAARHRTCCSPERSSVSVTKQCFACSATL